MARVTKRSKSVGGLTKRATRMVVKAPGGEKVVLQAVRDILNELRQLRSRNERLERENMTLRERVDRLREQGRRTTPSTGTSRVGRRTPGGARVAPKRGGTKRTGTSSATPRGGARRRSAKRQGGVEATLRTMAQRLGG